MELDRTPLHMSLGKHVLSRRFTNRTKIFRENKGRAYASQDLMGLELEVENFPEALQHDIADARELWKMEKDGSLLQDDRSLELKFRAPLRTVGIARALGALEQATSRLGRAKDPLGPFGSFRTSTHVHINMLNAVNDELFTFLYLYCAAEPLFINYYTDMAAGRDSNVFCIPLNKCRWTAEYLRKVSDKKRGGHLAWLSNAERSIRQLHRDRNRYASLNVCALAQFGSLEFRVPPLLSNYEDYHDLIKIIQLLKHAAISAASTEESLSKLLDGELSPGSTPAFTYLEAYFRMHGYGKLFEKLASKVQQEDLYDAEMLALTLVGE